MWPSSLLFPVSLLYIFDDAQKAWIKRENNTGRGEACGTMMGRTIVVSSLVAWDVLFFCLVFFPFFGALLPIHCTPEALHHLSTRNPPLHHETLFFFFFLLPCPAPVKLSPSPLLFFFFLLLRLLSFGGGQTMVASVKRTSRTDARNTHELGATWERVSSPIPFDLSFAVVSLSSLPFVFHFDIHAKLLSYLLWRIWFSLSSANLLLSAKPRRTTIAVDSAMRFLFSLGFPFPFVFFFPFVFYSWRRSCCLVFDPRRRRTRTTTCEMT